MRHIRISAASVLLIATAVAAQDFQSLAQQAIELQQSGKYAAAEQAYRQLLALDPNQVATRVNLAIVMVNLGEFEGAIEQYKAAEKLLPGDPRIELNLGLAYQKSGRLDDACRIFDRLHATSPQETQPTLLLADCSLQAGHNARVIDLLAPLASQDTNDLAIPYMLGMALLHEHRLSEAQVQLDRILRNGDTAESHFLLGTRAFESADYPAAIQQFNAAAELNPKLPQLHSFLGRALLYTGDPENAAKAFRLELASNPSDFAANLGLAQILIFQKRFSEARPLAQRAHESRAASAEASLALGQALAEQNQYVAALPLAESAAQATPNSAAVHSLLASVYAGLRESAAASRETRRAAELENAEAAREPGPKLNDAAPDFSLPRSNAPSVVSLHGFRGKSPVVLIFGSYTCPNFRDSADTLKSFQARFGKQIPFLLVYIREAHSTSDWQSARNDPQAGIAQAVNLRDRQDHAAMCSRKLHLPFPAVVDGMDNAVETAYAAWPSRVFIVNADGRIAYTSRLTALDFHPAAMEAVLRRLSKETSQ